MAYRMFLDDERDPPRDGQEWVVVRSYDEAVAYMADHGIPTFMSFDHDLGGEKTGMDVAKWLVAHVLDRGLDLSDFSFYVHSQNPVGARNIGMLLDRLCLFLSRAERN